MSTTIRINKDVKELLKLKSVETGVSQIDLANRYILYGIKYDDTPSKPIKSIEEIEKLLKKGIENGNVRNPEQLKFFKDIKKIKEMAENFVDALLEFWEYLGIKIIKK